MAARATESALSAAGMAGVLLSSLSLIITTFDHGLRVLLLLQNEFTHRMYVRLFCLTFKYGQSLWTRKTALHIRDV